MGSRYRFGRFELDPAGRQLLANGQQVFLGARAFDVLVALVERNDRLVTKGELLELAWPGLVVEENNLQVQISTLRRVLGPQAIVTFPRRGYRLTLLPESVAVTAATSGPPTPSVAGAGEVLSIAVLPFINMSEDPESAYFAEGLAEDILIDLSKFAQLRVIARNSSFAYRGKPVDIGQVARKLRARYLLEGSVRTAGNRVRVTSQLIDATTAAQVWADRFDRDLSDIFIVQDEITRKIIEALKIKLAPEVKARLTRRADVSMEAYNLFLRGREQALLLTKSTNAEARRLLSGALAISPGFASAQACIAFTHVDDYVMGWSEDAEHSLRWGLDIAQEACARNDGDAFAHVILSEALLWSRQHDKAMIEVQRGLALEPSSALGHMQLAHVQYYLGHFEAALETLDAYMLLDPLYPEITLYFLAQAQEALGQFDAAVATLTLRLARNTNSETSYALLASCYGHLGRFEEGRAAWERALSIAPDFSLDRRRKVLPYKDPAIFERRVEGLRKAGLAV